MGGETAPRSFGTLPDGREVTVHTLCAPGGLRLRVLDLGATVQALHVPDGSGGTTNVALGHPDAAGYAEHADAFLGSVVGRYANRIGGACFPLDDELVQLAANEGGNTLHGGPDGFHRRIWRTVSRGRDVLVLELVSPDGDQGFPGEVVLRARYAVEDDVVTLDLEARTDAPTVVGPASHLYLNLAGEGSGTIDDHRLTVEADRYLPVGPGSLPLGGLADVAGTPFDLTAPARIGDRVRAEHPQTIAVRGIDHSFHLRGTGLRRAALLEHPASGRSVELRTDQPALQVYTGNSLDGTGAGSSGRRYRQGDGVALEPQRHPDSPNRPELSELSDPVLRPGETYHSRTEWRFRH
ncbi:aldose epimerase family protein [uncultured Kocuria sp.]|uniref:aldose epimerase family protein n=1 Tax=uncultured Kocuria sp. TaxID=259305 RepID=UPI002615B342|nr:aldose epimerase family protein [uncultured Kocuria sp.]